VRTCISHPPVVVYLLLLLLARPAGAQPVLRVENNMDEGVYFWIKSEARPAKDWTRIFVAKGRTRQLQLASPDRFHVAVEDQQHRIFSAGFLPLKAMIANNPVGTLDLGGVFETMVSSWHEWLPRERRWVRKCRERRVRTAVTYTLEVNGYSYDTIEAPRSQ
jgi:hypothetical protein